MVDTKTEQIVHPRDPWDIYASVFAPRLKEADCRAFYDSTKSEKKMFLKDWARLCNKEKFCNMCAREDAGSGRQSKEETLKALGEIIGDQYGMLYEAWGVVSSADLRRLPPQLRRLNMHVLCLVYVRFISSNQGLSGIESRACLESSCRRKSRESNHVRV